MKVRFKLAIGSLFLLTVLASCSKKISNSFSYSPAGGAYHEHKSSFTPIDEKLVNSTSLGQSTEEQNDITTKRVSTILLEQKPEKVESNKNVIVVKRQSAKEVRQQSRQERKAVRKQIRTKLKEIRSNSGSDIDPVILALLSIIFPLAPIMMYIFEGSATDRFWISLVLALLFYLPAVIYNFIIMLDL